MEEVEIKIVWVVAGWWNNRDRELVFAAGLADLLVV